LERTEKRVRPGKDWRGFDSSFEPGHFSAVGNRGELVRRPLLWIFGLFCIAALLPLTLAIVAAQVPSAKDVVSATAFTSFEPVARGADFQIAVVMKIRDGYHVNARETTLDYLIPTDLKLELPAGFKAGTVEYPKGTLKTFSFSKTQAL